MKLSKAFCFLTTLMFLACNNQDENNIFDFKFPEDCCTMTMTTLESDGDYNLNSSPKFYLPCVLVPNGGNLLDQVVHYGTNSDIIKVIKMEVFSQDGSFVFSNEDFPPNEPLEGWPGFFDRALAEGPFQVKSTLENSQGVLMYHETIVCSVLCELDNDLIDRGLSIWDLQFGSQHDGKGRFDPSVPHLNDGCF